MSWLLRTRTLFRVYGFPIKVNLTWLFLLALILYTLGGERGLFNVWLGGNAAPALRWTLALAGALGLFASLLVHELCHSIVAHHTGVPVRGITLFIFGGVSELEGEPPTALAEFVMAVMGPVASALIGSAFLGAWLLARSAGAPSPVSALMAYLGTVNWVLAVFNSIPAFPLDGGRVVRSLLWGVTGDAVWATRWAAGIGGAIGMIMIVGGVMLVFTGSGIGGVWLAFIGFFVRQAAGASVMRAVTSRALEGERVGHVMTWHPVTVTPETTLQRFVDEYVLRHHFEAFPVVDDWGMLVGVVGARAPSGVDHSQWQALTVADVMQGDTSGMVVRPESPATEALQRLSAGRGRRLIAVEAGQPVGILGLRDLMSFVALKNDLSRGARLHRKA
jgi:Zn-dependent protease/CBS domain-containing protein